MSGRNEAKWHDAGLLVIRLGVGAMFVAFGWPKWKGGRETWEHLGGAMTAYGITFWPVFWGFLAMTAELAGGLLLMLGLLVRPAAAMLCFTMITAAAMLIGNEVPLQQYAHPVNMAIVFAGLALAGGGRLALGSFVPGLRGSWFA